MLKKTPGIKSHVVPSIPAYADGKEYIVSLNPGVDYAAFWQEIETNGSGSTYVPDRAVRIIDERPGSQRSCHYVLTDAEAALLKNDVRVASVVVPIQHLGFKPKPAAVQTGNFNKPANDSVSTGNNLNYGLVRHNSKDNVYGTAQTAPNGYTHTLDGSGVDVVIMDTGIQANHPEFQNSEGYSRVVSIDWYSEAGISGSMPSNFYTDHDGHGTHVAGIATGKTYGWAKNAAIYSMKLSDLTIDGNGINSLQAFDLIIGWHRNKPVNPETGIKRPTIVNMSWGFSGSYYTGVDTATFITGGNYRGTPWTGSHLEADIHPEYGMGEFGTFTIRDPATDSILEEMIDAGIHVAIAAGNDGVKIDLPGGPDYNNYFLFDTGSYNLPVYYNQGSSPYSTRAINVGCLDLMPYSSSLDQKADFSEGGPGVDIYACGYAIYSATSNTNTFTDEGYSDAPYYLNAVFKQGCITGTSMASPQVCGLSTLILQVNPTAKPAEFKNWLTNIELANVGVRLCYFGGNNDYTVLNSLWGGLPRVLFNKFNNNTSLTLQTVQPEPFAEMPC